MSSTREQTRDAKRMAAEALAAAAPLPEGEAGWARDVRADARARLLEMGAPARRDEYWKYTDPAPLAAPVQAADADGEPVLPAPAFAGVAAREAVFLNGRFRADLSGDLSQDGLAAQTLAEALSQDISFAQGVFGVQELAGQEKVDRPLAALNTSAALDGLALHATGAVAEPVHIRQGASGPAMLRHVIRVDAGASLTVIESGVIGNVVMEVALGEGAEFHHVRLQDGPRDASASHLFATLEADSQFKTFTLTADGTLTRNEVVIDLAGDGASGHIAGGIMGGGASHVDNTVFVTHSALDGESRQVFKNVLADQCRGIFQGKIFVREGAQKTDGYQISQALLLNDGAEFSAKPELEIYADDVACSHGSTTGAIDPTALFYLRSRGVTKAEAEALLVAAFVDEAVEEIADERLQGTVRDHVAGWMAARVGG